MPSSQPKTRQNQRLPLPAARKVLKMRNAFLPIPPHETAAQFYDFAPAMYVLLDATGLVVDVNQTGCRMLAAPRKATVGSPFRAWLRASDWGTFLEHQRRCRSGRDVVESEVTVSARDGGAFAARLYTRLLRAAGRTFFPTVAIDLTELRSLERAQQAAEREREEADRARTVAQAADSAKDRLIAMVSHELRNPLNPALMAAEGLSALRGLPEHAKHLALVIKRNIELEARLISDLLDIARVVRGQLDLQFGTTDIHEVVLDALGSCAPAAQARSIALSLDLQAAAHHVNGDAVRLRQVFWNVLNNAVKFSEPGGRIHIRTENVDDGSAAMVKVTIRDRGVGISPNDLQRLFTPFDRSGEATGHRGGLGLGLAIAKSIIDGHGGRIAAASSGKDLGTTVNVVLRTSEAAAESNNPQQAEASKESVDPAEPVARSRVLIVEDHADTGAMLSLFLSQHNCDVTLAQSLADGLNQLSRGWDVVMSDIGLEDGSGLEIGRRASALAVRPRKLIALSGYGALQDIGMSLHAGFDEHLVKPVDLKELLRLIG